MESEWSRRTTPIFLAFISPIANNSRQRHVLMTKKKEGIFEYQTYTFTRCNQNFELDQVRTIQQIDERLSGNEGGHLRSYKLNLVFNKFSRINIVDHGLLGTIRQESRMLSEFLSVSI